MTTRISDLHIARDAALPAPLTLRRELPSSQAQAAHGASSRATVRRILRGEDPRLLVITGPCSIHDPASGCGQCVTDGCIGWDDTVRVLDGLADAVRSRAAEVR